MHYFGQFKNDNSGREKENYTNDPIFHLFLSSSCLWYSFLYLKNVKIHFHGVPRALRLLETFWLVETFISDRLKVIHKNVCYYTLYE